MAQTSLFEARVISKGGRGPIGLAMLGDTVDSSIIYANGSPKGFHYIRDCLEGGNTLILISLET